MGLGDLLRFAGQYAAPGYARGKVQGQAQDRQDELDRQRRALELYAIEQRNKPQPINWQTIQGGNGEYYQVNPQTGETRPLQTPSGKPVKAAPKPKPEPGWQTRTAADGTVYQVNPQTGETRPVVGPEGRPQRERVPGTPPPPTPEKPKIAIPYTGYTQRTNPFGQTERTPESLEDYVRRLHQAGIAPEVIADWISQQGLVPK